MRHLFEALPAPMRGAHAPDSAILAPLVADAIRADDVVTIKGSKSMKLGVVVDTLKALGTPETSTQKIAS